MYELIILGLLKDKEYYGYQLKNHTDKLTAGFFEVSYGSLYPRLKKLESSLMLESKTSFTEGGQEKTKYKITEKGEDYFLELMKEIPEEKFSSKWVRFRIKYLFFAAIEDQLRVELIKNVKDVTKREKQKLENLLTKKELDKFKLELLNKSLKELATNLEWLDVIKV